VFIIVLWPIAAVVAGAGTIAPEVGGGTLAFLLSRPVTRGRVWTVKVATGLLAVAVVAVASLVIACLFDAWARGAGHVTAYLARLAGGVASSSWGLTSAAAVCLLLFAAAAFVSTLVAHSLEAACGGMVIALGLLAGIFLFWTRLDLIPTVRIGWMVLEIGIAAALMLWASWRVVARGEILVGGEARHAGGRAGAVVLAGLLAVTVPIGYAHVRLTPGAAMLWAPVLSPRGDLLLATATNSALGSHQVWGVPLGQPGPIRAIGGRLTFWPAFSPDGRRVAWLSKRGPLGLRHDRTEVHLADADGGNERILARELSAEFWFERTPYIDTFDMMVFSPDGSRLALCTGGRLTVFPTAGGEPRVIVLPEAHADTKQIVGWSDADRTVLVVSRLRGTSPMTVVHAVDVSTGEVRELDRESGPVLSWHRPAQTWSGGPLRFLPLVVASESRRFGTTNRLVILPVDASSPSSVVTEQACMGNPSLSGDGRTLAYAVCLDVSGGRYGSEIRIRDLVTREDRSVAGIEGRAGEVSLSPDGTRVAANILRPEQAPRTVVVSVEGAVLELPAGWTLVGWSGPDDLVLAQGSGHLARADVRTGGLTTLFPLR
jgi:ABC-2 family transporter/WD40 repeat protein